MTSAKIERKYLGQQLVLLVVIVALIAFFVNAAYQAIYRVPDAFVARDVWWRTDLDIRPVLPVQSPDLQLAKARIGLPCFSAWGWKFDVEMLIDEHGHYLDGRVAGVTDPELVRCIVSSLQRGSYEPARYRGRAVPAIVRMRWDLKLRWCGRE